MAPQVQKNSMVHVPRENSKLPSVRLTEVKVVSHFLPDKKIAPRVNVLYWRDNEMSPHVPPICQHLWLWTWERYSLYNPPHERAAYARFVKYM